MICSDRQRFDIDLLFLSHLPLPSAEENPSASATIHAVIYRELRKAVNACFWLDDNDWYAVLESRP